MTLLAKNPKHVLLCDFSAEANRLSRFRPPVRAKDREPTTDSCAAVGCQCVDPWRQHLFLYLCLTR